MRLRDDKCQSCGMPVSNSMGGGGTNADGTKNFDYCSLCYVDGKFTHPCPLEKFQEFNKQKMRDAGRSSFSSWLLTRGMKRLKRWHRLDVMKES